MAMVLDAFASYVQNMLTEIATEEVHMLLGVEGEIEKMGARLGDLKNFLADADRRNITDQSVQEWVGQLKRAMYEATNILDLCQLKAMEQGPSTVDVGCFNPLVFCLRNPLHAHDIGRRIKELNQSLGAIKARSDAFSFINLGSYEDRNSKVRASRPGNDVHVRESTGELDRSGVVGEKIKEDTRKIVETMLTEKQGNNNMAVAIIGVGGIGKTTLAQKVFNDEAIQRGFDKKIWLSINQVFSDAELLRRAITEAGGDHRLAGNAKATLQRTLKDLLDGHKTLLVMDDVWNHEAWECVLKTPFVNASAPGSRVLVTTRDERVARGMKVVLPYHHIDKLEDEDAWSLLHKQVVSSEIDGRDIDMLKDIGLKIIAKCGGLPLAVKVMGGLLCQREKKRGDWQMVLNDSVWSVSGMPEELNNALYLSYEDLPPCIRQCFLYYSLLPKSTKFFEDDIIGMWISEGFLHGTSDDLEELGRKYHKELILRNLIEPDAGYVDQCVCNMHDVVRSFAQYVARDEALAAHGGETGIISKLSAQKFLRLSLESKGSEADEFEWSSLQNQKSLRTLILIGHANMKLGDSLGDFPCVRTLHIDSVNDVSLAESLDQLKHLRYLSIQNSDISTLPDNIGNMKFLQYISLFGCGTLVKLPDSIVKLRQLRFLRLTETSIEVGIPRGFRGLTNLRNLCGFPTHGGGDWCSLEELGHLSQLRILAIEGLENVCTTSFAAKARIAEKVHLTLLNLCCTTRLGDDGLVKEEEGISEVEQRHIEEVFDELCPPSCLDNLDIEGYFGQRLPRWMMSSSVVPLKSLRILMMEDLACCIQLPSGLCQLPCLQLFQIRRAPSINRIGPEFLQLYHQDSHHPSQAAMIAFPRLHRMYLLEMVEWKEWEWEEKVQAMPALEQLVIGNCKLSCIPAGLASQANALKTLSIQYVKYLKSLDNFASLVELQVSCNPDLESITNLPKLQKLLISTCPKLLLLEGVPALQRLVLEDYGIKTLPEYMRYVNPRHLELECRLALLSSIATGQSGPEWDKFSHVKHIKAYAHDGDNRRKWYVLYTRNPFELETNISWSSIFTGTLWFCEDEKRFESVFKMTRRTFNHICSLLKEPSVEDTSSYTFLDGRLLCLEDRVAAALIVLNSGEPLETIGSSVGMNQLTVSLVTASFVDAMVKRAAHHSCWPGTVEMKMIKSMFDKTHGLPNCCGVVHTTAITFGSQNCDHDKNLHVLLQTVVDADMRLRDSWLGWSDSMNQWSILHDSQLFKKCDKGAWLNGRKLHLSCSMGFGEYIIGDAGYPLLPWLLTPYPQQDKNGLSKSQAKFNKRHSAARTIALNALARLKDTWRFLHGGKWLPENPHVFSSAIHACCILHNIVIDMEEEVEYIPSHDKVKYSRQVRRLAHEDAVKARDIVSWYLRESAIWNQHEETNRRKYEDRVI